MAAGRFSSCTRAFEGSCEGSCYGFWQTAKASSALHGARGIPTWEENCNDAALEGVANMCWKDELVQPQLDHALPEAQACVTEKS